MSINFDALSAPFPADRVSWRVGTMTKDKTKAMALAYLDARDVMERLDEVCGPPGWQNRYTHAEQKTVCEIGILTDEGWVWKADGAGDSDIEAEKGALSDAFKRAAVRWGIGRYLYDLASPWVEIDEYKRIKQSELPKLRALLNKDAKAHKEAPVPVEQRGLFIACKAAIDIAADETGLQNWAEDNRVSMDKIKAQDPEVYHAVRAHWAKRLGGFRKAKPQTAAEEFGLNDEIPEFA